MQHSQWCGQLRKAALKLSELLQAVIASVHMYLDILAERGCSGSGCVPVYCIPFPLGSALLDCLQGIQGTSEK